MNFEIIPPPLPQTMPKRGLLAQVGAICTRRHIDFGRQILMITSRDTGRWIIPKGWPLPGYDLAHAAAHEAWEEAGVVGRAEPDCIGAYTYHKRIDSRNDRELNCLVALFHLRCEDIADDWPQAGDRRREWFRPAEAAGLVAEAGLARVIANF